MSFAKLKHERSNIHGKIVVVKYTVKYRNALLTLLGSLLDIETAVFIVNIKT